VLRPVTPAITAAPGTAAYDAQITYKRLLPRIRAHWDTAFVSVDDQEIFENRLEDQWPRLFSLLRSLYGHRYDFFYHLERITLAVAKGFSDRSVELKEIDHRRVNEPDWFSSQQMVGGALYVDLFSENLGKLREHIAYFGSLGLTYLHLMPLFAVRPGDNDGGYAISNYRSVDPRLGTIDDLEALAADLHQSRIVLVLDFVFNHTADDHFWAKQAMAGDPEFQDFYYMFPNREMPDRYETTLREIFPTVRRGNFTWNDSVDRWIWTTFNSFQWDLNYSNPAVFEAMLAELLFIANTGVDILRFDAVAFIWKRLGTSCENLPEAHHLIQAFNACVKVACPGVVFKSEAIVHPDEVVRYIGPDECQLSYNPTLMALCWESLATRDTKLLKRSLLHRHHLPGGTSWVNYLRCHDDVGWTFDDADASAVGINAFNHRQFLNRFYTGQFPGSFARGVPFQENPDTGDMRISGTMASLAGLEQAIDRDDPELKEMAIRRILLLNSIILTVGGIPLLYLGEEWGTINDYDFVRDPAKASDTRWVHRPKMRWEWLAETNQGLGERGRIYGSLRRMIAIRKNEPAFAGMRMELIPTESPQVLSYIRQNGGGRIVVLANFAEYPTSIEGNRLRTSGLGRFFRDLIADEMISTSTDIALQPYQFMWLARA